MQKELVVRSLSLDNGSVIVRFSPPELDANYGGDFVCHYEIAGLSQGDIQKFAVGIDAVQALLLAMKRAGTDLYTSAEWKAGRLTWTGGTVHGDLGFPVPDIIKDIPPA